MRGFHPAVLLVALGACSFEYSCGGKPKADVAGMEKKIQEGVPGAKAVDCPDDLEPKTGATHECTVELEGGTKPYPITVTITETGGAGFKFDYSLKEGHLLRDKVLEALVPSVRAQTADNVNVDCGPEPVIVKDAEGLVWCRISDGTQEAKIKVAITGDNLKWEAVPPPGAPTTPPENTVPPVEPPATP